MTDHEKAESKSVPEQISKVVYLEGDFLSKAENWV